LRRQLTVIGLIFLLLKPNSEITESSSSAHWLYPQLSQSLQFYGSRESNRILKQRVLLLRRIRGRMQKIDLRFISEREGGQQLKGYVPMKAGIAIGESGVTIATGVDLGQMNRQELSRMKISTVLKSKLGNYVGIKKAIAIDFLKRNPLTITRAEAIELDTEKGKTIFIPLINYYNQDSIIPFHQIPSSAQTVLASLAWHRGPNFRVKKQFIGIWNAAIYQNWEGMAEELRAYKTAVKGIKNRRLLEASLLDKISTNSFC
jgi:hypothetical protein